MMKMEEKSKKVRVYLTMDRELFQQINRIANNDYMKVATWTTRFLKQELTNSDKPSYFKKSSNDSN